RSRAQPLRSLVADDFADLRFLKDVLKDKRIVQLGETNDSDAESGWLKARIVRFLHAELGFDAIAFEGSPSGCEFADRESGKIPPIVPLKRCPLRRWQTEEALELFAYVNLARKAGKTVSIAGFEESMDFDKAFPGRKVVVWATNDRVVKQRRP